MDIEDIFTVESLQKHFKSVGENNGSFFKKNRAPPQSFKFPDFGAHQLQPNAVSNICSQLRSCVGTTVISLKDMPSVLVTEAMAVVWRCVLDSASTSLVTDANIKRVWTAMKEEMRIESEEDLTGTKQEPESSKDKQTGNTVLIEAGIRTGLTVVFTLLKQAWSQLAWQRQIEQAIGAPGAVAQFGGQMSLPPQISLPNEVLKSVLDILGSIPPLALSNPKALSKLSMSCLKQSTDFLEWILKPDSQVDAEGKRLACEITLALVLQQGSLIVLMEWLEKMLLLLESYSEVSKQAARPALSMEFCHHTIEEIRKRTQLGLQAEAEPSVNFEPQDLTTEGHAKLLNFVLFLAKEVSVISKRCTQFFDDQNDNGKSSGEEGRFLSETCEVYAFGSNSSSQLAMGSTEKFLKASSMTHMANVQMVHAGQYCTFLIFSDGSVKACGKGSYGRLGLGNSENQPNLRAVGTFPAHTLVRTIVSSKGSDGHSMAITAEGGVYSWGDGNYGKLGHGDTTTQKTPKLISFFTGKVVTQLACGNRHTAAVTVDGELYTWGEGENGRLGHGNTTGQKTPTKVQGVDSVREAACGVAHTLVLSSDGLTIWSFGSGDAGKLGHGDSVKQTSPKVIEALRGMVCQKVCAASQFSLVLTAGGKVYSFGNGSGVGKGTTEPRQYIPWLIEPLENEMVIDICTGDGHCLALTQRGEVFAWGTNSMGQCGQGHNNGSITTPAKVQGLDGVQVQQISAGTSHSIVWTAMPMNRRASAMWQWPYCVAVNEATFKSFIGLLNKYGGDLTADSPAAPFTDKDSQESFLHSVLSLTSTHISLVAPLGPSCVRMACGHQVKPLRNLLFNFIDSQLPSALDKVTSDALEVGSAVLLPPVVDRVSLLLTILPDDPAQLTALSTGQRHYLNILLQGFSDRNEFVGLICEHREGTDKTETVTNPHTDKLYTLCRKMVSYLHYSLISTLNDTPLLPDLKLGSSLLKTFERFLVSVLTVSMVWIEKQMYSARDHHNLPSAWISTKKAPSVTMKTAIEKHYTLFYELLRDHSMVLINEVTAKAKDSQDPVTFLKQKQDLLLGFLCYQFPTHIALTVTSYIQEVYPIADFLLELAQCVHGLVTLFPTEVVQEAEERELLSEPVKNMSRVFSDSVDLDLTKLRGGREGDPWVTVMDYERLLCRTAATLTSKSYKSQYISSEGVVNADKKPSIRNSHFLCNGLTGNEQQVAKALTQWVSLCKHLPGATERLTKLHPPDQDTSDDSLDDSTAMDNIAADEDYYQDYISLSKVFKLMYPEDLLSKSVHQIEQCDLSTLSPLLFLAVGSKGNKSAQDLYDKMMEVAHSKDWNTSSDEDAVPQLRQVSCAALACLLKHTGLFNYATNCSSKPKKTLVDVYRSVFNLRREVFNNRPVPDTKGETPPEDAETFESRCNSICANLLFLLCLVDAAVPEESDPIVPQIVPVIAGASTSVDTVLRSPDSTMHRARLAKGPPLRLLSHQEGGSERAVTSAEYEHSTSVSPSPLHSHEGWSLPAVKQALSHLRWQRDRQLHAAISHGLESSHTKICSVVIDNALAVFGSKGDSALERVSLLQHMLCQQQTALGRQSALNRIMTFLSQADNPGSVLTTSKLAFLGRCLPHDVHYSAGIMVAPSVLQHEVKNLSHCLLGKMVKAFTNFKDLLSQRSLLLTLQWSSFNYHPGDLLYLFSDDLNLYSKVVSLSGVVSSCLKDSPMSSSRLASRVKQSCVLLSQLLSVEVGVKSEVLKTSPEILSLVSKHLFGQLEGFVNTQDPDIIRKWDALECSDKEREDLLGEFLTFINTLSATHKTMRSVLASDPWFQMLLRIVDVHPDTGKPVVSSLKTRLLALQALGAIMADLTDTAPDTQSKCAKIVDDLLELMSRCMFLSPLTEFRDQVHSSLTKEPSPTPEPPSVQSVTFPVDPINQDNSTVSDENGVVCVASNGRVNGYVMGTTALTGKHSWKITSGCEHARFCVGVAQKPLTDFALNTSDQFWLYEAYTGRLLHNGETGELLPTLSRDDNFTVSFNKEGKTLSFRKNEDPEVVAFRDVSAGTKDLFPVVLFSCSYNTSKVYLNPFTTVSHSSSSTSDQSSISSSGYPVLSPTGSTLVEAVLGMLYNVQTKEPWKKAITSVLTRRLTDTDDVVHRLLDFQVEMKSMAISEEGDRDFLTPLSRLLSQFTQLVWPCLVLIGGLESGFCLGKKCQVEVKDEQVTGTIVSVPNGQGQVTVQEQVTAGTNTIQCRQYVLADLKLIPQDTFSLSLLTDHITPSILMNLAHLAGYLDKEHSLLTIVQSVQDTVSTSARDIGQSVAYQRLCSSQLQLAATKALHTILYDESIVKLLTYRPPSFETVILGDYVDKSELSGAVKEVLKCLALRAVKPSPLTPALTLHELERLVSLLGYQTLSSIANSMSKRGEPKSKPTASHPAEATTTPATGTTEEHMDTSVSESLVEIEDNPEDLSNSGSTSAASSVEDLSMPAQETEPSSNARAPTPPIVTLLMDMGFSRAQVNIALNRCDVPANSTEEARMQLLVSWIIDHPNAVAEEEAREEAVDTARAEAERAQRELQQRQQEADRNAAADEFLSIMLDPGAVSPSASEVEAQKSTRHGPDLLEGPDIDEEVPDISVSGLDSSPQSLKSLLSALGLSKKHPTPKLFEFGSDDPLGSQFCKSMADSNDTDSPDSEHSTEGTSDDSKAISFSRACENAVDQVKRLKNVEEHLQALNRITAATQTLVARRVIMLVIASLSTQSTSTLVDNLESISLDSIQGLVRLLRLVDAGRIDGTSGESYTITTPSSLLPIEGRGCLSSAITTAVSQSHGSSKQLLQSCSRDLLAAAVGGTELLQQAGHRRRRQRRQAEDKSDLSVLTNPNFSVTQNLVQTLAKSTGQVSLTKNSAGMLQIIDALAACLFSSKLKPEHRFWALEQLMKVFSSNGRPVDVSTVRAKEDSPTISCQLEHLIGHKGQIMNCAVSKSQNDRVEKVITIGEDNAVIMWDLDNGLNQPETNTLTFPTPSQETQDTPPPQSSGLMLPTLTQSFSGTCVAGALDATLCVWRTRDGKTVTERFTDLITAMQWKPSQKGSETPVLLVGLLDGGVVLIEVLRDSGASSSPPVIQTSKIESKGGAVSSMCWSPSSGAFAVGSTASFVQVYVGAGSEYTVTTEIKEIQVQSMCWSPDESFLTSLEQDGTLKLWDVYGEVPAVVHSFDAYPTSHVLWHPKVSSSGDMLLASGSKNGSIHLWTVRGKRPSDVPEPETDQSDHRSLVTHVTSLDGHLAPITSLVFNEEACLVGSGCKAGSVRVWDLHTFKLLKFVGRSVGEVLNLCWTTQGLAICYNNTCSLCILPPSPGDYTGERCLQSCLPSLHSQGIVEVDKAPCLMALLRNLHLVLQDQYNYEETAMAASQQLVHTEYLQLLTCLTVGLRLHTVFLSPPHPPHLPAPPLVREWTWLANFTRVVKMADSLCKRTALPEGTGFTLPAGVQPPPETEKYQTTDNSMWTLSMDSQIMEWLSQRPQDWWVTGKSNVYTWGKGTWNQLGHTTAERGMPGLVDSWNDVQQIVAGSYCTYAIKFDGGVSSVGEGSYGRLGHGGSENENDMRTISALQGIPIIQLVAGPRVSTSTDEGFALALSETGDVYSWGKRYKGRLGHQGTENHRAPKLVEAFSSMNVVMIAAGDYHCAVLTSRGELYTMGSKENGKLGRGSNDPSNNNYTVGKVERFLDADESTQLNNVNIGHVSCGQCFTLAISEDGTQVFGFGKADGSAFGNSSITGDHNQPFLLGHLSAYGPFTKSVSGNRASALLNNQGRVLFFGSLVDGGGNNAVDANIMDFPDNEKITDLAAAGQYIMALSGNGNVYYWGKNAFGTGSGVAQSAPKLIEPLVSKGLKQISAGVRHSAACDTNPPVRGSTNIRAPSTVPAQYGALKDISGDAIYSRMLLLSHFSRLMMTSWKLFHLRSTPTVDNTFSINPLCEAGTRSLLAPASIEGLVAAVISKTMNTKQHGPSVNVTRLADSSMKPKAVFPQLAAQVLQKPPRDLRCSSRAWKVTLGGEGADDAGGVFDETVAQMCEELEKGTVQLLIPTPNARNKCGFNTDRFVFDPTCTKPNDLKHLKFMGILLGVAMRTKKPLDLHLAQPMWKLLAGMALTAEDLEEIDMIFIQSMTGIREIHKSGLKEEDFAEMIPIESFEAQSMNGTFVPIVPGGGNIKLTFQNRKEYVEKALNFRLHELDKQVAAVREGMATIVPVPLLSLYTATMLERAVCGSEDVDLMMLKKVVRYRDGTNENTPVVTWLWQTLESFTNEERVLFLRFVSGRSRLPVRVSEITQRFQISVKRQVSDDLPTSQTCFFQLRLPSYTSQEILAERLRYAITHCRSIDMDTYMLRDGDDLNDSPEFSDDDIYS